MSTATTFQNSEDAGLGYTGETWDAENRRFHGATPGVSGDLIASGFGLCGAAGGPVTVKVRRKASFRDAHTFVRDARVRLVAGGAFLAEDRAKTAPWDTPEQEVTYTFTQAEGADLSSIAVALAVEYVDPQGLATSADVLEITLEA
jgi:hypothetical protein